MDDLANTGGRILGGLLSANEIYHGGLMNYLANRQQLLQDPSVRSGLGPFGAGLLEIGGQTAPQVGPGMAADRMARGGITPGQYVPDLPPLSPEQFVKSRLGVGAVQALQDPGIMQQAAMHELGVPPAPMAPPPGMRLTRFGPHGGTFEPEPPAEPMLMPSGQQGVSYDPRTGKYVRLPTPPGATAIAVTQAQREQEAKDAGFKGASDPAYKAAKLRQAQMMGLAPPPAASPAAPAPAAPAAAAPGPARGPVGPTSAEAPDVPVEQLPFVGQPAQPQRESFLSRLLGPATASAAEFPPQPQAQPAAAPAPPSRLGPAALPALPPGSRISVKSGGTTFTRSTPAAKPVPAAIQRLLVGQATAADAADQALQILERGPQSPLTVGGMEIGTPPSLTGPVSGRALGALAKVSGQPLAQEEVTLAALVAHAMSGVFTITGLRPNERTLAMFDPLTPSMEQPKEIMAVHLRRLSKFYRSWQARETELSNLSDTQRAAMASTLMTQVIDNEATHPGGW